jgi:very-short-patch-repair endonuclease
MRPLRTLQDGKDIVELARERPRAYTRTELRALSSDRTVRSAIDRGDLVRLLPNTYVAAEHADSFAARADAALTWAGPAAALTGRSACFAWTLIDTAPDRVDLALPQQRRLEPPPWLACSRVPYARTAIRVHDFTAVAPAIAIASGYADLTESEQVGAIFGGIHRGIVTVRELRQALVDMPKIRARRALTSRIEAAERGAESWLEEQSLRTVFAGREFDRFVRQHRIRCRGRHHRLDMYDPFTRTAVELDSRAWHSGEEQRLRDIRRDADLASIGILTVRLATRDLMQQPEWCRDVVRGTLANRRPA